MVRNAAVRNMIASNTGHKGAAYRTSGEHSSLRRSESMRLKALKARQFSAAEIDAVVRVQSTWRVNERRRRMQKKQKLVRSKMRSICVYFVFLAVFTVGFLAPFQNEDKYHFLNNLRTQFSHVEFDEEDSPTWGKTMDDVATVNEMYQWLKGPFLAAAYGKGTYDGQMNTTGYILGYGRVVGGIRIGQIRAKERPCHDNMEHYFFVSGKRPDIQPVTCYGNPGLNPNDESKESYGLGAQQFEWAGWNGSFTEKERSQLLTYENAKIADREYQAPAFTVILPNNDGDRARELLMYLKNNGYVDLQTKAVFIDVNVYNVHLSMIAGLRMYFQMTNAGGVLPVYMLPLQYSLLGVVVM
eukprot:g21.t1